MSDCLEMLERYSAGRGGGGGGFGGAFLLGGLGLLSWGSGAARGARSQGPS